MINNYKYLIEKLFPHKYNGVYECIYIELRKRFDLANKYSKGKK